MKWNEQIGKDRRICNMDGKAIKTCRNRALRRLWKRDPEAHPPKYKGYIA